MLVLALPFTLSKIRSRITLFLLIISFRAFEPIDNRSLFPISIAISMLSKSSLIE